MKTYDSVNLGKNVRMARRVKELSQTKLAEVVKVTTPTISAIENGKAVPRADVLFMICEVLDINVETIFD